MKKILATLLLIISATVQSQMPCILPNIKTSTGTGEEVVFLDGQGDINGDGFTDVMARIQYSNTLITYYGGNKGLQTMTWSSNISDQDFLLIKDFNGDKYGDLLMSHLDTIHLYSGGPDGISLKPYKSFRTIPSNQQSESMIFSVRISSLGDFNNDGMQDIAVVYGHHNQDYKRGFVKVYSISSNSLIEIFMIDGMRIGPQISQIKAFTENISGDENPELIFATGSDVFIFPGSDKSFDKTKFNRYRTGKYLYNLKPAGDINGDGYADLLTYNNTVLLHLGNKNGFDTGRTILIRPELYDFDQSNYFGIDFGKAGDINKDGVSDFYITDGNNSYSKIYLGDRKLQFEKWKIPNPVWSIKTGVDINKDEQDDLLSIYSGSQEEYLSYLATSYGAGTGYQAMENCGSSSPVVAQIRTDYIFPAGDINGDGKEDILTSIYDLTDEDPFPFGSSILQTFIGTEESLQRNNFRYGNRFTFQMASADVNGDGYRDGMYVETNDFKSKIQLYLGSKNGFPQNPDTSFQYEYSIGKIERAGDLNKDGYEDIFVCGGKKILLYNGSSSGIDWSGGKEILSSYYNQSILNIGDLNKDNTDDFIVVMEYSSSRLYFGSTDGLIAGNWWVNYNTKFAGDVNGDGFNDVYLNDLELHYGDKNGFRYSGYTSDQAILYIGDFNKDRYADHIKTVLDPATGLYYGQVYVGSRNGPVLDGTLKIKSPLANKSLYSYGYAGDMNGDGAGDVFMFNGDYRYLVHGVPNTDLLCKPGALNVVIPDAFAFGKGRSAPNTIYLGTGNNRLRLVAFVSRGTPPYRYRWSDDDTLRYLKISHNIPGTYQYTVVVHDGNDCVDTAKVFVKVIDNLCINYFKVYIENTFPALLIQPWIQDIIRSTDRVKMCLNGQETCVLLSEVQNYFARGAVMGTCEKRTMMKVQDGEDEFDSGFSVSAYPNPSASEFTVKVTGNRGRPFSIRLYNSSGMVVLRKDNQANSVLRLGSELNSGLYFMEIMMEGQRRTIRLVKSR